ncbi:MAG TPA: hypothetical protein VIT68_01710 [Candidatus Gracilibacteria bacterium]
MPFPLSSDVLDDSSEGGVFSGGLSNDSGDDFLDLEGLDDTATNDLLNHDPEGATMTREIGHQDFSVEMGAADLTSQVEHTLASVEGVLDFDLEEGKTWDTEKLEAHHEDAVAKMLLKYAKETEKTFKIYHPEDFPGGRLITEGDRADKCYLIVRGSDPVDIKKIVRHPRGEVKIKIDRLGTKGDAYPALVGEIGLITDGVRTADVVLTGATQVYEFTIQELGDLMVSHPDLQSRLEQIGEVRLEEQIRLASRAEDAILAAQDKKAYREFSECFDYSNLRAMRDSADTLPREVQRVKLKGTNRADGSLVEADFVVTVDRVTDGRVGDILVEVKSEEGAFTNFTMSEKAISVGTTKFDDTGLENCGLLSQIYRPAFAGVSYIESSVIENDTIDYYARVCQWSQPAPSAFAAHSPLVAARKGFVSEISGGSARAEMTSYRVDQEVEDILYALTNLERSLIDDPRWAESYRSLWPLYEGYTPNQILEYADQALRDYLKKHESTLDPKVLELLDLQIGRNAQWRSWGIPGGNEVIRGEDEES